MREGRIPVWKFSQEDQFPYSEMNMIQRHL
jgi:hypothetical protein